MSTCYDDFDPPSYQEGIEEGEQKGFAKGYELGLKIGAAGERKFLMKAIKEEVGRILEDQNGLV